MTISLPSRLPRWNPSSLVGTQEVETLGPGLVLGVGRTEEEKAGGNMGENGTKKASNVRKK